MEDINNALLKRALGYTVEELTSEYTIDEKGNKHLVKIKSQSKYIPPDLTALKTYMDINPTVTIDVMTDEELEVERQRLLKELL